MVGNTEYEVLAIKYGIRLGTRSEIFLNYHLYGEPDGPLEMDYFFWVIRNRDRTVLVDCGFSEHGGRSRGRTRLADPVALLADLGTDPASVDQLVVTHAHYDHIGNLSAFPDCEVVVAADEVAFWSGPYAGRRQFAHAVETEELAALSGVIAAGRAMLVDAEADIAPGIRVVKVGGHTPGQLVVIVRTAAGETMLASDAVHYYEELELDRPFSTVAVLPEMYRAFDLIREFQQGAGTTVVASHDPLVTERFPRYGDASDTLVWKVG
ncbi:MAG: N-acyl homoserine lactonase family protein [Dactylosporangium sp.]|nr:N-acyl homoserine lactonase family protein [Dactylosporangium sp.]